MEERVIASPKGIINAIMINTTGAKIAAQSPPKANNPFATFESEGIG